MRLREIAQTLERELPSITFTHREFSHNIAISNFKDVVRAAEVIRKTGALVSDAERVLRLTEITRNVHDEAVVSRPLFDQFHSAVDNLASKTSTLLDGIRSVLGAEAPDQLSIKLPDETDLTVIADTMKELEKALTQAVVNEYVNGEVKVLGFDRGSNWVDIAVHGTCALIVIGHLLRLIIDFQRKKVEISEKVEMLRTIKIQNDIASAAQKALEHEVAAFLEDRIRAIAATAGAPENDNEFHERLKFSVRTLGSLVTRGLEVHPSLNAPPETASVFPPAKEIAAALRLVTGQRSALTDGASEPPGK